MWIKLLEYTTRLYLLLDVIVFSTSFDVQTVAADDGLIQKIAGHWSGNSADILISSDDLGGWSIWTDDGQGNISLSGDGGGNIRVNTRTRSCSYRVTVLGGGTKMRWRSVGDAHCQDGEFDLISRDGSGLRVDNATLDQLSVLIQRAIPIGSTAYSPKDSLTGQQKANHCNGQEVDVANVCRSELGGCANVFLLPNHIVCGVEFFRRNQLSITNA